MRTHHEAILVGLDIDRKEDAVHQGSRQAAHQAAWLAKLMGARLRFVHSTFDDRLSNSVELTPVLRATLEDFVAEFMEDGLEAELVVSSDRAWHVLIQEVLAGRGDLVVVGKREREREKGRKLGAVARKLLRKCPCPVWVVRPEHDLVYRLVLAATDFSEVGQRSINFAGMIAGANEGCELHIVHSYRLPEGLKSEKVEDAENDAAIEEFKLSLRARIKSALPP
ncbi:MAG: universal stress protein, partial [Planctomycetota bacterium]